MTIRKTANSILEEIEPGILRQKYNDGSVIDLEEAQLTIKLIEEMIGDKPVRLINDLRAQVAFTRDARDHFKKSSDDNSIIAFIVNSKIGEVTVNFFLKLNKPTYALKVFDDEEKGLAWIKAQMEAASE